MAGLAVSACDQMIAVPSGSKIEGSKRSAAPSDATSQMLKTYFPVTLSEIADGVWVHTSAYRVPGRADIPANGLIIADGDSLIMVDTPWGEMATLSLLDVINAEIGKPVTRLIVTHHHVDSVSGVDLLEAQGATVYTHPDTPVRAAAMGLPVPNTSVAALKDPQSRTKVGAVEIAYPGAGHAEENLVVYIPKHQILFGGCAIKGAQAQTLGNLEDAKLKDWPTSLNWIKMTYPDTRLIVPGHGKGADLSLIDKTLSLIAKAVNSKTETDVETDANPVEAAKTNPKP